MAHKLGMPVYAFLSLAELTMIMMICRRDVPVGVPLDLSTPTGMGCIGTYGENCKSVNVSKYRVLLVAFLLLWHENLCHGKTQ